MSTNEENISDPNIAKPPTQKKPSGYQYELMRRERAERQKEAARLRAPYLAERAARPPAVPVRPERAHLFMLGELVQQACDIANDPGLTEEDRWDRRNATAHAMAKISANAECEREAAELEAVVNERLEDLKTKKRALQMAAKKHTCVECQRKMDASA